jgi:hypothetical protein
MANKHIGTEVNSASINTLGDTSPHVDLNGVGLLDDKWSVCFRGNFLPGNGPEPIRASTRVRGFYQEDGGRSSRRWSETKTLYEDKELEEARQLALEEAQKRNVVLYKTTIFPRYSSVVVWCPDDWSPIIPQ